MEADAVPPGGSSSNPAASRRVPVRLVVADDHPVLRSAVRRLLERAGYEVVAEVGDGEEAIRVALAERPDLVLLDRVMPRIGGIEATRRISVAAPEVRVVIISGQVGSESIAEAGRAGASGFIAKTATQEQMLEILSAVSQRRAHTANDGAGTTIDRAANQFAAQRPAGVALLTPREREVLRLVAGGHSSQGVAAILQMSPRTVETHRQHIMRKLGIHSVAGKTEVRFLSSQSAFDCELEEHRPRSAERNEGRDGECRLGRSGSGSVAPSV